MMEDLLGYGPEVDRDNLDSERRDRTYKRRRTPTKGRSISSRMSKPRNGMDRRRNRHYGL